MLEVEINKNIYPKFHFCILNWNGAEILDECLESVFSNKTPNYKVTVIDNDSSNFSPSKIDSRVNIIQLDKNYGFSKGYNLGIDKSDIGDDEYIILLNYDATIDENFISSLSNSVINHGSNHIYGVKILFDSDKNLIWYAGGTADLPNGNIAHIGIRQSKNKFNDEVETDYVTGCCMIIHRKMYSKLNGFDETFFMYNEDLDLCIRAKRYGAKCLYIPSALAYHKVSMSTGGNYSMKKILLKAKSSHLLFRKYYKFPISILLLLRYFIKTLINIRRA